MPVLINAGNLTLSILPMIYLGSINLFYYIYANLRGLLARLHVAPPLQHRNITKEIIQNMALLKDAEATPGPEQI